MTGTPPDSPNDPGPTIGHYAIVRSLGRGGMGEVFLAHDTKLDRRVALKLLSPEFASDTKRLKRFEAEARTLAALNHPNIVTVFAVEESGGQHVIVMEFVDGKTLRDLIPLCTGRGYSSANLPKRIRPGLSTVNRPRNRSP